MGCLRLRGTARAIDVGKLIHAARSHKFRGFRLLGGLVEEGLGLPASGFCHGGASARGFKPSTTHRLKVCVGWICPNLISRNPKPWLNLRPLGPEPRYRELSWIFMVP